MNNTLTPTLSREREREQRRCPPSLWENEQRRCPLSLWERVRVRVSA